VEVSGGECCHQRPGDIIRSMVMLLGYGVGYVTRERDDVIRKRYDVISKRDGVIRKRDDVIKERDDVTRERDDVTAAVFFSPPCG